MSDPLRFGLRLMPQDTTVDRLRAIWRLADDAGFDHVWGYDHMAPVHSDPAGPCFEGWTLLPAMAEATKRVRIGVLVSGNIHRHPAMLARMAATVDHLSAGRLEFGIGAGWAEAQLRMLGMSFPSARERVERLDEACELITRLWSDERANFDGRYYRLADAVCAPKPVQQPRPPIWIGGTGERRLLRVVARHADVWAPDSLSPDEGKRLCAVLDGYCAEIGRDAGEIRRSRGVAFDGTDVDLPLSRAAQFIEAGFTEIIVNVLEPDALGKAETVADKLLPRLRELG